jgi:hypothetical protein
LRKKRQREAVFNLTGQGYLHIASSLREERSDEAIQRLVIPGLLRAFKALAMTS